MSSEESEHVHYTSVPDEKADKPRKVRGAYHNPVFTKITKTSEQRRKDNKIERQRRKAGRK